MSVAGCPNDNCIAGKLEIGDNEYYASNEHYACNEHGKHKEVTNYVCKKSIL